MHLYIIYFYIDVSHCFLQEILVSKLTLCSLQILQVSHEERCCHCNQVIPQVSYGDVTVTFTRPPLWIYTYHRDSLLTALRPGFLEPLHAPHYGYTLTTGVHSPQPSGQGFWNLYTTHTMDTHLPQGFTPHSPQSSAPHNLLQHHVSFSADGDAANVKGRSALSMMCVTIGCENPHLFQPHAALSVDSLFSHVVPVITICRILFVGIDRFFPVFSPCVQLYHCVLCDPPPPLAEGSHNRNWRQKIQKCLYSKCQKVLC